MLQDTHELDGRIASFADAWQQGYKIGVAAHTFTVVIQRGLGHTHMGLVNPRKGRGRGTSVPEAVGFVRLPEAGTPLGWVIFILYDPLGKKRYSAQWTAHADTVLRSGQWRFGLADEAELHVVAMLQGLLRQNQFKDAVFTAYKPVAGMALKFEPLCCQPEGFGLWHVFAPPPDRLAAAVFDQMRAEGAVQVGIGPQRTILLSDAQHLLHKAVAAAQKLLAVGFQCRIFQRVLRRMPGHAAPFAGV